MSDDEAQRQTAIVNPNRKKGHSTVAFLTGIVLAAGTTAAITYILVDKGRDAMYAKDKAAFAQSYALREKSLVDQLKDSNERAAAASQCSTDLSAAIADVTKAKGQYESLRDDGSCLKPLLDQVPAGTEGRKELEERIISQYELFTLASGMLVAQPETLNLTPKEKVKKADRMYGISQRTVRKKVEELRALLPPDAYPGASASQPYDASAPQPAPASQLSAGPAAAPAQRQGDLGRLVRKPRDNENYRTIHGIIPVKRDPNGYF